MDRRDWDERYRTAELVWRAEPNRWVAEEVAGLSPGRALDLACGEGRNAVWLAEQGWVATGVDFSPVGLDKGRRMAAERGVQVTWVEADARTWEAPSPFDLVVVCYLQLPEADRRAALGHAAAALAPGGTLLVVGHDRSNRERGVGGPQDPAVLFTPDDVVADLQVSGVPVEVQRAEVVRRPVDTDGGPADALDALVRAKVPV